MWAQFTRRLESTQADVAPSPIDSKAPLLAEMHLATTEGGGATRLF
jgi:hypothetical protein